MNDASCGSFLPQLPASAARRIAVHALWRKRAAELRKRTVFDLLAAKKRDERVPVQATSRLREPAGTIRRGAAEQTATEHPHRGRVVRIGLTATRRPHRAASSAQSRPMGEVVRVGNVRRSGLVSRQALGR